MASDYTHAKKVALRTIIILAVVTVVEVLIALTGRGHLIEGVHWPWWLMNLVMISLSLYKAYLIVGIFMHLKHEVNALALSVVLPTILLIWAIIAFLYEGNAWQNNRDTVKEKDEINIEQSTDDMEGMLRKTKDSTKEVF